MGNPQTQILIHLLTNDGKKAQIGLETVGDPGNITQEGGEAAGRTQVSSLLFPRDGGNQERTGPSASAQPLLSFLLTSFQGTESRVSPALKDVSATKPGRGVPLADGAGRLGAKGCSRFRGRHQLSCLHAVLNPNVHGLKITQLPCRSSALIRLGGVENTRYIRDSDVKSSTWAESLQWNSEISKWGSCVLRTQSPSPGFGQAKAKSTTLRRKASCSHIEVSAVLWRLVTKLHYYLY